MSPYRSSRLTRRLAATLGAILLADLVFVTALLGLLAPIVDPLPSGFGGAIPAPLWWGGLVILALGGLLAVQLHTARRMALTRADVVPLQENDEPALFDRVRRLSTLADHQPPSIGRIDSDVPNCFSVGGRDPMLVVSTGLLDTLTDDELDAVLAHELAHVQNNDATVMTLATFLPTLVGDQPVAGLPRWLRSNLFGGAVLFAIVVSIGWAETFSPLGIVLTALASLVVGGIALGVLATPVAFLSHRLSQDREFAADLAGARLSGNPEALVSALRKLDDDVDTVPTQDLRSMGGLVQELCFLPHGFVDDDTQESANTFTISLRSHPPTSQRIERLRELTAEME